MCKERVDFLSFYCKTIEKKESEEIKMMIESRKKPLEDEV